MADLFEEEVEYIEPNPASIIESLRSIGYTMETAIADLIDNSITAQARYQGTTIENKYRRELLDIPQELKGETKLREVKARVNQNVFREIVLANYDGKCALTGTDLSELFEPIEGRQLITPRKYNPNPLFLEWHRDSVFEK